MRVMDTMRAVRRMLGIPVKPVQGLEEISLAGRDGKLLNRKKEEEGQ